MNTYLVSTIILAVYMLCLTIVVIGTCAKYPTIPAIIFGKNLVWEVQSNGNLRANKAKIQYGSMKTKKGIYFYERLDVVICHGKPGIIVNESDAKAIRPSIQPVFSLMKKLNIPNRESLDALLSAPMITTEQYKDMKKAEETLKQVNPQ